jgi:hypothetical protein
MYFIHKTKNMAEQRNISYVYLRTKLEICEKYTVAESAIMMETVIGLLFVFAV